jgi:hypothetical protein
MTRAVKLAALSVALLGFASSAGATPIYFAASLDAAHEFNVNDTSLGTGSALITFDFAAHTMRVQVTFSGLFSVAPPTSPPAVAGLPSGVTASHIHCCVLPPTNAPVATVTPTFPGFPTGLGVTSGTYDETFDMSLTGPTGSWNTAGNALLAQNGGNTDNALAALIAGAQTGQAYINIHTNAFRGGEIRGYLVGVPEPSPLALFGFGLLGLGFMMRKRVLAAH